MTRVIVNPGICGFITTIEVAKISKQKVSVKIVSTCEMVNKLSDSLTELDKWQLFKPYSLCKVYRFASECSLHISCPVPIAILKAVEVEAGVALPRDATMRFETTEHK